MIGCIGLVLAKLFEVFRSPYLIFVSIAALLLGAASTFDRRIKLALLDDGIRYAQWGPVVVPWQEFSAYRRASWRRNPYLQLMPCRPSRILDSFSLLGKLNHRLARIVGVPVFSIAVTPLEITETELEELISQYLPKAE